MDALDGKDVLLVFPTNHKKNSTVRILKTPKTESRVRKIFLPKSVANMLVDWKAEQDEMKEILGDEYMDYNLVMASTFGLPLGDGAIRGPLKKLIEDYNLPPVVFHSFRHSSVTYKLKLNGGDIKAVQGNSGHAQVNMVTDVYSHILDDDRYLYIFSVEEVNRLASEGMPFRDAYKKVGLDIEAGKFTHDKKVHHTHEGSIGNLCNDRIESLMRQVVDGFNFSVMEQAERSLLGR